MVDWFYNLPTVVGLSYTKVIFLYKFQLTNDKLLQTNVILSNYSKYNLHTILWLQVFLINTNNLHTIIWFQVFLWWRELPPPQVD